MPKEHDLDSSARGQTEEGIEVKDSRPIPEHFERGDLVPGRTILGGRYRIEKFLAEGGMGEVWQVFDLALGRLQVLKLILPSQAINPRSLERFKREAEVMAALDHPNIVKVFDAGATLYSGYILVEHVVGQSLDKRLKPGVPMPLDWTASIVEQLCDALEEAHSKGIVHRDLKPSNLMLVDNRPAGKDLKVLDLGIAKILSGDPGEIDLLDVDDDSSTERSTDNNDQETRPYYTLTGQFLGTPAYASPEQASGKHLDNRSDIYSVGVMVFEFLTGHRPFSGTPVKLLYDHRNTLPPPFPKQNPDIRVGREVEQVVLRCLGKNPNDRYQTARELDKAFSQAVRRRTLSDLNLEKTILRNGLATASEIDLCKAHKAKLAGMDETRGLLEIMVEAKVLTRYQSMRLLNGMGDSSKKLEIPGYVIIDKLGGGSMGVVLKARQTSVDRIVAVKILLDALAQNDEFIERFERAAKVAAKLLHNNIINVIDAGEFNGHYYIVLEYVEGSTVKDQLDRHQIFDEKTGARIVLAVAKALKHVHQRGFIHRDVKPEHVMLTKEGNVKLAGLELARLTADENLAMTEAGFAIGTPFYMSPEQVRGQVDVDIRADIYSLGATFYHMVTGVVPYSGESPSEVMRKHVDKNTIVVPPDHLNTKLSGGLCIVVETMLAKNRDNRYHSTDELILDLKCLLRDESPMIARQKAALLTCMAEGKPADLGDPGGPIRSKRLALYKNDCVADLGDGEGITEAKKTRVAKLPWLIFQRLWDVFHRENR